ncbi:hypothetical protein [Parablautia muri]|uniref:Uncharacterized protein n=1 Tax=Parablautia muri TaxID=2320879 RepID=A0A9X5GPY9_9FIRM|nr:hypothetical protein [Parablautia muri]NBJ91238.1 hypothetical protein [Parablautia muri]
MLSGFNSGLLEILWNTSGFTLRVDPKRKEVIPELKEKEFIDYAFSIIRMVADLAEGKSTEDALEKDLETASEIYARENDLKNHLYVKRNSKINCFKHFESQIISYRNEENPKEIAVNSAIVRVMTEMEDEEIPYTLSFPEGIWET